MTLTLELSPETEARLNESAEKHGLDATTYALELLETGLEDDALTDEVMPKTGAELVEYLKRHGVIGAWADREDITDTYTFARQLRYPSAPE